MACALTDHKAKTRKIETWCRIDTSLICGSKLYPKRALH